MGKHGGRADNAPGTDAGPAFDSLDAEDKAVEFGNSHSDPRGYAMRNFSDGTFNPSSADGIGYSGS